MPESVTRTRRAAVSHPAWIKDEGRSTLLLHLRGLGLLVNYSYALEYWSSSASSSLVGGWNRPPKFLARNSSTSALKAI